MDRIGIALTRMVTDHPFYACLVMNRDIVRVNNKQATAAAGFPARGYTDGRDIFINVDQLHDISVAQLSGLIRHEAEHKARLHSFRMGTRNARKWNRACDYIINNGIIADGESLPSGGLADPKFNGMNEEQVYNLLPDEDGDEGGKPGVGGDEGDGDALLPPPCDFDANEAEEVKEQVYRAAAAAKAQGKLPGHVREILDHLAPPKKNWQQELKEFVNAVCELDYSWNRCNRMFLTAGVYLPGRQSVDRMGPLGVVLDTSGSVSAEELRQYFGDLKAAVEAVHPLKLIILYVDAGVSKVVEFDEPHGADIEEVAARHGGGGTDMTVGLQWLEDEVPDLEAAIVFTDGDTPFGHERSFPVLWGISSNKEAPWGRTLCLV